MTITLYDSTYSGHCHKVRLLCGLLHLDVELEPIDTRKKEQKAPAYLKLNPFGQIPVLKDGDVVVRDSNAILLYLAEKYDSDGTYLPADPVARAHVYEWLATAAGPLYLGPARARVIKQFGRDFDYEQARAVSEQLFSVMNDHLATRSWLVGDGPTLADVACYSYIAVANEGGLDLAAYPNILAWLERVADLDSFVPMPGLPKG
jgi:glutathione S-transferase